jgi:hypothetical protein
MRKALVLLLILSFSLTGFEPFFWPGANSRHILFAAPQQAQYPSSDQQAPYPPSDAQFSPEQMDNLLAPIALYPDPLLAQVLVASTFVDQVTDAAQWLQANNDPNMIDMQPWDVSVKAVAHYPAVLFMMNDKIDWTTSLGQVYVDQSTDVMTSVQRLRGMARSSGALVSSPQQQVIEEGGYISIDPYNPRYIYVPVYDPGLVYYRRSGIVAASLISFGAGLAIGAWLNNDFDWRGHRVYYHGWQGGGWIARSRMNVRINNIYVNNNYNRVNVNRSVMNRSVNYNNLNRYSSVHQNVPYNNVYRNRPGNTSTGNQPYRRNESAVSPMGQNSRGSNTMRQNAPAQQRQMQRPDRQPMPQTQQVRPQQQRQNPQAQQQRQAQTRTVQPQQRQNPQAQQQRQAPQTRQARPSQQRQQPAQKQTARPQREASKQSKDTREHKKK